jgi:simple sugar transport system substrate-binding protein
MEVLGMKRKLVSGVLLAGAMALGLTACSDEDPTTAAPTGAPAADELITVGFAQTGSESGWRAANTESMKEAFSEANGFELIFNAADNKPEAQIAAVNSFINQGVDVIILAAVVTTGWDDVLQDAKDAGIVVVLEDRTIDADESLYAAWYGLDFHKEGVMAGEWAAEQYGDVDTKMVVLEGTTGSGPAIDRATGFDEAIAGTQITKIDSQTGDFTRAGGKAVMEGFLQKYGVDGIDLLFAHNDDMGLGAIDAIEAAGGVPGEDIKIITIDAVKDGMTALAAGKINYIVECKPLLGPGVAEIVKQVLAGETVEKKQYVKDDAFDKEAAIAALPDRKY